jgi:hypothetical protein
MDVHNKGPLFSIGAFSLFFDPLLAELCLDPLFGGLFVFCKRGGQCLLLFSQLNQSDGLGLQGTGKWMQPLP